LTKVDTDTTVVEEPVIKAKKTTKKVDTDTTVVEEPVIKAKKTTKKVDTVSE